MDAPPKRDFARGWLYAVKLIEEQSERLATLSDEEVDAELRRLGIEPEHVPTVEELLADLERRAAERAGERAKREDGVGGGGGRRKAR